MHELHRAFGDVIGPHQISEATRLAVYRYAIFLLGRFGYAAFRTTVLSGSWELGVGTGFPAAEFGYNSVGCPRS